ncbi:hypothetical protein TSUD_409840 [Trifolium subterraneum]|uniref:Integrase catalytic domain-containing protein n=1 Tax=Trifolium subterraneum TaxID=3900 RepID=A0A2Z6PSQ2_TRISU|nr:hypothetical protein TSUD_409840 [Trifolium subterraneum]
MVRRANSSFGVDDVPAMPALTDPSQNPYYVHPNESATAALVSPLLDGKNYHAWSRSMMKVVIMKNKLRFLDGSCPMPDQFAPTYEPWIRCNNLVLSWLMNSVVPTISQSLVYTDSAAQAWSDLKARFSRADRVHVASLQRELYVLRQESSSVTEFFTKLKGLWEELELSRPIPNCTCTFRCVCEAMRNAKRFKEEDLILLFLTGLNDRYAMVRSQILLMEPFPILNVVFGLVIQHESINGLDITDDQLDPTASAINFARKSYGKANSTSQSQKKCTYCHKTNHVVDNCFRKHGFPPGYRFKDGTVVGSKNQGQSSANCVNADDNVEQSSVDTRMTFSAEDYQALMALLKNNKPAGEGSSQVNNVSKFIASSFTNDKQGNVPNHLDTWIIDSGATDHVCASLSLFTEYRKVNPIPVKLPNGSIVTTDIIGNIIITPTITLKHVLYMPHFSFNLISVSRVSKDLDCVFAFTDNLCFIQNSLQRMIGSGRMLNGLYYLEGTHSQPNLLTAKQRKLPYATSNSRASVILELLHMDIWGPFSTSTTHDHKYFLTIVDDFSRFTWIVLLKGKYEVASKVQEFINFAENHFCHKQNGRVERKHQCILNIARALMTQSHLPAKYWGYAVLQSVFIMNRVPSNALKGQIPFVALYVKLPELSDLKVFGSLCFVSTHDNQRSKLDPRARKCVYLGIKPGVKGYVALDLHNYEIIVSRNVVFEETIFPYPVSNSKSAWEYVEPTPNTHPSTEPTQTRNSQETTNDLSTNHDHDSIDLPLDQPSEKTTTSSHDQKFTNSSPRRSTRIKQTPLHLMDYQCNAITHKTPYPISSFISHNNLSKSYSTFCLPLLADTEPTTYAEASKHECWVKAMKNELTALANNKTWIITDLPEGVKPIGSKWVYKIKRKADGTIDRYIARLVAKGYNQIEGVDFSQTFSPVAKMTTIRTVLAIASIKNWHIHQLDVDNAFLHGDLDENVYMTVPQGFEGATSKQGLEVAHSQQGIPMDPSNRLHHDDSEPHSNITEYRALVGKLLYLTSTRPDIAFPVQQLSQFLDAPTTTHFKAAHKVLRYLKGNPGTGLFFPRNASLQLMGFSDADWGGCPDSRRSITGYCFFIGQSLICWKSKKQLIVSKSSSEAEYRALASATCELQWLSYLLKDLQVYIDKANVLYCDSQSALHIASNPVFHERTKHLDIDCHIVREKLQAGLMKLLPISGYIQTADILTKALHPANFHRLFSKLGLINIFRPQLEGVCQNME